MSPPACAALEGGEDLAQHTGDRGQVSVVKQATVELAA
jgi:hypothetical protein